MLRAGKLGLLQFGYLCALHCRSTKYWYLPYAGQPSVQWSRLIVTQNWEWNSAAVREGSPPQSYHLIISVEPGQHQDPYQTATTEVSRLCKLHPQLAGLTCITETNQTTKKAQRVISWCRKATFLCTSFIYVNYASQAKFLSCHTFVIWTV
jgi:hypothetical protein